MWILTALSREPFKRPLLIFLAALGAVYPLLVYLLAEDPIRVSFTYASIAAVTALAWPAPRAAVRGAVAAMLSYLLALYFFSYPWLFYPGYALLIGFLLFPESFRVWKWLAVSAMFFVSLWAASVWQQMLFFNAILPQWLIPAVPGCLLSFSLFCTFVIYRLEKDPIREAFDHYEWTPNGEARNLATQVLEAYDQIREESRQGELRDLSEKTIHLCHQLQEIFAEVKRTDMDHLEKQIQDMEDRAISAKDPVAKRQYEQALGNKTRQKEHYEALRTQFERIHGQIVNYLSALENIRLAYANRNFKSSGENRDVVELFLNVAKMQAETAAENAEVYEKLSAS
jgi:hypothetical protein